MISSIDDQGNTALHVAAYRGQLAVLEALIQASPLSASVVNHGGNTFLHVAVSGFQTPGFRRLDQQIELAKHLVSTEISVIQDIINFRNNEGRTALHLAIIGNIHSDLVQLLMSARFINLNIWDDQGMTPLDYLKRQPKSASSEILIRQLISAGGISSCRDSAVRKAFAAHLKMQGICSSPGTSFRVLDNEIFVGTGVDRVVVSNLGRLRGERFHLRTRDIKKSGPLHDAAKRIKLIFHWPLSKKKETPDETPVPLRERYSNTSSLSSNKRTLAARSNISSPINRKKLAAGDALHLSAQHSFSKASVSSASSSEKGKEVCVEDEIARLSCSKQIRCDDAPKVTRKQGSMNKRLNPILCFGGSHISVKNSVGKHCTKQPIHSVA